jgi:hypothetical protein
MIRVRVRCDVGRPALEAVGVGRLDDVAALEGALKGDPRRAGVETGPAPLVVGVVGVGAEDEQGPVVAAGLGGADDEEGVAGPLGPVDTIGFEHDLVEARAPAARYGQREGDRPAAAACEEGLVRNGLLDAGNALAPPDRLAADPDARDVDGEGAGPRRAMEGHLLALAVAQPAGVTLHRERQRVVFDHAGLWSSFDNGRPSAEDAPLAPALSHGLSARPSCGWRATRLEAPSSR